MDKFTSNDSYMDYFSCLKTLAVRIMFFWFVIALIAPDLGLIFTTFAILMFSNNSKKILHLNTDCTYMGMPYLQFKNLTITCAFLILCLILFIFQGPGLLRMIATIIIAGFFPVTGLVIFAPVVSFFIQYKKRILIETDLDFYNLQTILKLHVLLMLAYSELLAMEQLMLSTHFNFSLFFDSVFIPSALFGIIFILFLPFGYVTVIS